MNSKRIIVIFLLVLTTFVGRAQLLSSPFQLKAGKEALITGATLPLITTSFILNHKIKPLTDDEIGLLDAAKISRLDRVATGCFNPKTAKRSDLVMMSTTGLAFTSSFIIPTLYSFSDNYGTQTGTLAMIWLETNLVNYSITELTKTLVKRKRPFLYNKNCDADWKSHKDACKSFFSGHTSFTAANSFFIASTITSYQKGNTWNPVIWGIASLPPLLIAWQRVKAGKHFPSDVIIGYLVGAASGILIPKIHERSPNSAPVQKNGNITTQKMQVPLVSFKFVL